MMALHKVSELSSEVRYARMVTAITYYLPLAIYAA
jgi:hypothetical protein